MIPDFILNSFGLHSLSEIEKFGTGLIHETYKVKSNKRVFLVQKLNHNVFKDIDGLMNNAGLVLSHLKKEFPNHTQVEFVKSDRGGSYITDNTIYWRCMHFIENSHSFEHVENLSISNEAGKVIGNFHCQVSKMDASHLIETIPNFHNFNFRLEKFKNAIRLDQLQRLQYCRDETEFLLKVADFILLKESQLTLPIRVIHNDTKLNNILFDTQNRGICLVDLDTLMPGKILYDTGDALRTMCNTSGEDGTQGKISFEEEIFVEFVKGYVNSIKDYLTLDEIKSIPFSMIRMTGEQSIRFLTDYLEGDIYYRQVFKDFNLICSKVQNQFLKILFEKFDWMENEIQRIISE